jgi:hypothetical protein
MKSGEEADFIGDAGGVDSKRRVSFGIMEECSTAGVSSQYLFIGWYSFELGSEEFELGARWTNGGGRWAIDWEIARERRTPN